MSAVRRSFRLRSWLLLGTAVLGGVSGILLWRPDRFERWRSRAIERYLRDLEKSLPFEIETVEVRKNWRELFSGHISVLNLTLRHGEIRAKLTGPLEFTPRLDYRASLTLITGKTQQPSQALPVRIRGDTSEIHVEIANTDWRWPAMGLEAKRLELSGRWSEGKILASARIGSLGWTDPKAVEKSIQGERLTLEVKADPEPELRFEAKGAEILWGEKYFDLPLQQFPLLARMDRDFNKAEIQLGTAEFWPITAKVERQPGRIHASWKSPKSPLARWKDTFRPLELLRGTISGEGQIDFDAQGTLENSKADIRIFGADFRLKEANLGGRHTDIRLSLSKTNGIRGTVSAEKFGYRRLTGKLEPTAFALKPFAPNQFLLNFGENGRVPWMVTELPIRLGAFRGIVSHDFTLESAFRLDRTNADKVFNHLCLRPGNLPPATLEVQFDSVTVTPHSIDPTGKVRAQLFGGFIEASDIGFFDLGSPVPEVDFNLEFDQIRLDQLGQWLNFGKMDGIIRGFAHDVTFQSWLPTRYHLRAELQKQNYRDIVFSSTAMRNFARLFAAQGIDQLPGLAKWYAFGWVRDFLGGYDIDYAGIDLLSKDGWIQIQTLDPPKGSKLWKKLAQNGETGKHFILYSNQFRMPLNSSRYPLVADARALANYFRMMQIVLSNLKEEPTDEVPQDCQPAF